MQFQWTDWEPSPRDILIDQVRRGERTPDEAEQEADRHGFGPLARKPAPCEFDPDSMHWWSLPMAIAWIAWRNLVSVREHCAEYRERCLEWFPSSLNLPANNGTEFARIDGYELRPWRPSSVVRHLPLDEAYLTSTGTLPVTTTMTVAEAEKQLFAALASSKMTVVAKDDAGKVVDIPQREWPYLSLLEERECDVLKRDALDPTPAFSEIKLQRDMIKQLWPEVSQVSAEVTSLPTLPTIGPISFALAAHWIASERATVSLSVGEHSLAKWRNAYEELAAAIYAERVRVTGKKTKNAAPEPIPACLFASIPVCFPAYDFVSDQAIFEQSVNDMFQLESFPGSDELGTEIREGPKVWFTGIQVDAEQVLALWPSGGTSANPAKSEAPALHLKILEAVKDIWPDGSLPARTKERNAAIQKWFRERNQTGPSDKTIGRALTK